MNRYAETAARISNMMEENGRTSIKFNFGLANEGVVLDSGCENGNGEWENYEVHELYSDMTADTNFGRTNLLEVVPDEDDWFTLEDCVKDVLEID